MKMHAQRWGEQTWRQKWRDKGDVEGVLAGFLALLSVLALPLYSLLTYVSWVLSIYLRPSLSLLVFQCLSSLFSSVFFFCILLCLFHVFVFFYSSLCIHFLFASSPLYFFFLFFSFFLAPCSLCLFFFFSLFLFFSLPPLKVRRRGLYIACTQFYLGKDTLH